MSKYKFLQVKLYRKSHSVLGANQAVLILLYYYQDRID